MFIWESGTFLFSRLFTLTEFIFVATGVTGGCVKFLLTA